MKIYNPNRKEVIVYNEEATPEFWDQHWRGEDIESRIRMGERKGLVYHFTTKYLPRGARVLDGGCGVGQNVYGFMQWGYDGYGVDYACETVESAKRVFPKMKLFCLDVRKTDFPEDFFDGYWSLGVIEHFWEGYADIAREMKRIVRPGGYVFLTFPYMSPLRRLKASLGFYKSADVRLSQKKFYQFLLNKERIKCEMLEYGFRVVAEHPFDGVKGLKDEIPLLRLILQPIYDGRSFFMRGIKFILSKICEKFAAHCVLLVLQKI